MSKRRCEPMRLTLSELRLVRGRSQERLAENLGMQQPGIVRIEHAADLRFRSLRRYVEGLGGSLRLVVDFPDFEAPVELLITGPQSASGCIPRRRYHRRGRISAA